jgi:hypothetical protein
MFQPGVRCHQAPNNALVCYKLKGYTQEQIKSWIAIEFCRMEDELRREGRLRVIDKLKEGAANGI